MRDDIRSKRNDVSVLIFQVYGPEVANTWNRLCHAEIERASVANDLRQSCDHGVWLEKLATQAVEGNLDPVFVRALEIMGKDMAA